MITKQQIRSDLRDIRYYYAKQKIIDGVVTSVVMNDIVDKVCRYNQAVRDVPIRLYDLYVSLYTQNNTQATLSYDWDVSEDYIKKLNAELCEYLYKKLNVGTENN